MKQNNRWIIAVALTGALAGCSRSKSATAPPYEKVSEDLASRPTPTEPVIQPRDVSDLTPPEFMHYIPADSPIVFASYEPIPRSFVEKMAEAMMPLRTGLSELLAIDEAAGEVDATERALVQKIVDKLTLSGLESIGIKLETRLAVYMADAALVVRMEIADGVRLQAFVDDLVRLSEENVPTATLGGQRYFRIAEQDLLYIVAIQPTGLVFAMMPPTAEAAALPIAFHQQKPDKSIVDTGSLRQVVADYGLTGYFPGYSNTYDLLRPGDVGNWPSQDAISPACRREYQALAEMAPRSVHGFTMSADDTLTVLAVLELREDLAGDLQQLVHPVPELATVSATQPAFAFGLGLDMRKSLALLGKAASSITNSPYECESLARVNELAQKASDGIGALPPQVAELRGALMIASELHERADGSRWGIGRAYLGANDPMALVALVQELLPILAALDVAPDGNPVMIPPLTPELKLSYIAVTSRWIGFSVGNDQERDAMAAAIGAPVTGGSPLAVLVYDYGRALSQVAEATPHEDDSEPHSESYEKGRRMGFAAAKRATQHLGAISYEIFADRRGIAVRTKLYVR